MGSLRLPEGKLQKRGLCPVIHSETPGLETGLLTVRSWLKVSSISERKLRVGNICPHLSEEAPRTVT